MFCQGHPVPWLTERENKSYHRNLMLPVRSITANRFLSLMSCSCLFEQFLWASRGWPRGRRLADVKSSGCIRVQGGDWVRKDGRDKRKERRQNIHWLLYLLNHSDLAIWFIFCLFQPRMKKKNGLLALTFRGYASILQLEWPLLCGHDWPWPTHRQNATMEKCLRDLWKTWKIHFNNTSNTVTLITGPLNGFQFQHAVYFLDKTRWHQPQPIPPGRVWNNQEIQLRNTGRKCTITHTNVLYMPQEVNANLNSIIFIQAENRVGLCRFCFSYHRRVSEIFVFHLGLVAHRSLRRGKSYIHLV